MLGVTANVSQNSDFNWTVRLTLEVSLDVTFYATHPRRVSHLCHSNHHSIVSIRKKEMTAWRTCRPATQAHSDNHAQTDLRFQDALTIPQHHGGHAGGYQP